MAWTVTPAEHKEFFERQVCVIEKILKMPIDELFIAKEVKAEIPVGAKIFSCVQCTSCDELVMHALCRRPWPRVVKCNISLGNIPSTYPTIGAYPSCSGSESLHG